jgi:hypothetical protein
MKWKFYRVSNKNTEASQHRFAGRLSAFLCLEVNRVNS